MRAKCSRVKNDMRSISVGVMSYTVDNNKFPCDMTPGNWSATLRSFWVQYLTPLSTPVAYLSSTIIRDPFNPGKGVGPAEWQWYPDDYQGSFEWLDYSAKNGTKGWMYNLVASGDTRAACNDVFTLVSWGPDRFYGGAGWFILDGATTPWSYRVMATPSAVYDSTNGTISGGDICRAGGAIDASTP